MSSAGPTSAREQGAQQQAILARIVDVLQRDWRVAGAWLSGSFGRGEGDEWADLDLHVAVEDAEFAGFLADRSNVYAAVSRPLLVQPEMPSSNYSMGDAVYQLVYFADAVMVDWNIGPASKATKPIGHQLLFERRPFQVVVLPVLTSKQRSERLQWWTTFFWAMAPIVIKYIARGATRQAASQTDLLARAVISLTRLLTEESGPDPWQTWTNRPLEDEIDAVLPRVGPDITPGSTLQVTSQLCQVMLGLHDALIEQGIDVHPHMAEETARLSRIAAEVIDRGDFPRRGYR